jgi:sugar O-acyltransferase (sialic acid O-acetyltransferase NeuD family)
MQKIIIIGGRGTAIVVADQIYDANQRFGMKIEVLGLALDDCSNGDSISSYTILCGIKEALEKYGKYDDIKFIYQLYRPDVLKERVNLLESLNIPPKKLYTFIHPTVMIAKSAKIGYGNVILANAVVNCNAVIGNCNTINSLTLFGHDTIMGNYNYIAGHVGIGSGLTIGDMNFIGLNSTIRNGLSIGNECIVGMASNVVKNLTDGVIVYGNPAKGKTKLNHVIR